MVLKKSVCKAVWGSLFVALCSSQISYAKSFGLDAAKIQKCFSDVNVIVRMNDDSKGNALFLADRFVKHGLKTAISRDEYIDRTIFGNIDGDRVTIVCDDISGDHCTTEDKAIFDDLGDGCYEEIQKVIASMPIVIR